MSLPLVSVIIPVLNGEKYISEAVNSILGQSYTNLELIVVNDGSTDRTSGILNSIEDPRVKVLTNPGNIGTALSTNKAIEEAKGKYIALMDADDVSLPDRIAKQVTFLENNPDHGLCGAASKYLGTDREVFYPSADSEIRIAMLKFFPFRNPTLMFRKEVVEKHNLAYDPEFKLTLDYEFVSRILPLTKAANLNEVLFLYREHAGQTSKVHHQVFLDHANKVKVRQLKHNLKISVSAGESDLHKTLLEGKTGEEIDFKRLDNWMVKLSEANQRERYYDQILFRQLLLSIDPRAKKFIYNSRFNVSLLKDYYLSGNRHYAFLRKEFGFSKELVLMVKSLLFWNSGK